MTAPLKPLQPLISLHQTVVAEREQLRKRLAEIDAELERMGYDAAMRHYGFRTPTGRIRNRLTMKETVIEVLRGKWLTKEEVLEAVLKAGYEFSASDPMNSVGVVLYGKDPKIQRNGRKFGIPRQG